MKISIGIATIIALVTASLQLTAQTKKTVAGKKAEATNKLYLDVHKMEPGKVKFEDVAKAHIKDLAAEKKYGANFIKYWVSEEEGMVFCLVSAPDTDAIIKTHAEAHGLMPERIYEVTGGAESALLRKKNMFMDIHQMGAGKVTKEAVADAHKKDLAVQAKYGANFADYWVDEKDGIVMCLVQAEDSAALVRTHSEAHGLIPSQVVKVKQGN